MGQTFQKEETKQNDLIRQRLRQDQREASTTKKLLLLGPHGSGKTTFIKQIKRIYGSNGIDSNLSKYIPQIHNHMIKLIDKLAIYIFCWENMSNIKKYDTCYEYEGAEFNLTFIDIKYIVIGYIRELKQNEYEDITNLIFLFCTGLSQNTLRNKQTSLNQNTAKQLQIIRDNEIFQNICQIDDSMYYFMNKIFDISDNNYIPTETDILRCYKQTRGINQYNVEINYNEFSLIEIGTIGERKKWMHIFSAISGVIYITALTDYCAFYYDEYNAMQEALEFFTEIFTSIWFKQTSAILMLNKCDQFAELIKTMPLTICFSQYSGDNNYDECIQYIQQQFIQRNDDYYHTRQLYTHITCCTDIENIEKVYNDIINIVINASLMRGGLMLTKQSGRLLTTPYNYKMDMDMDMDSDIIDRNILIKMLKRENELRLKKESLNKLEIEAIKYYENQSINDISEPFISDVFDKIQEKVCEEFGFNKDKVYYLMSNNYEKLGKYEESLGKFGICIDSK
eukprot:466201_1